MKRITSFTLLFVLLLSLFLPYSTQAADDITGHLFEKELRSLISKQIITGYGNGVYLPDNSITRAEFTTVLVKSLNVSTSTSTSQGSFTDVKSGSWYYPAVMAASKANLIQGYSDGSFRPGKEISRQEIAVMIKRAMDLKGVTSQSTKLPFTDNAAIGYTYVPSIESLLSTGIISGHKASDGSLYFAPLAKATRGESAAMLSRMLEVFVTGNYQTTTSPTGEKAVSVDGLNVRTGPGTSYSIVGSLKKASIVTTYQKSGDWYYVTYGSLKGYVHGAYLKDKTEVATGTKVVNTSVLNVRTGPGTSYAKAGSLQSGSVITTYNYSGSWVYMSYGSLKGYVHTGYLTDKAPLTNRVIAIDAGHGDHDPGAAANGVVEKEINLDVSKRIQTYLQNAGVKVVMTRTDDTFVSLSGRVKYATDRGADTFVSIHTNAAGSTAARGTETFYYTSAMTERDIASKQLSTFIQNRLVAAWGTYDRGVKIGNFQVIRYNTLPASLVELGFATNSSDAQKLASNTYREKAAQAIAAGIIDYYNWKESR